MKKDESMKEIEQLLELAPEVKDMRTKEELFARLKKEGVFHEQLKPEIKEQQKDVQPVLKQRNGNRLATIAVAAAALLTFGGMGGYILSQNNNAMDDASSGANEAMMSDGVDMESVAERSIQPFGVEESSATSMDMDVSSYIPESSLVFLSDLAEMQQLQVGLVTEQLDVVPVTVLIDEGTSTSISTTYLELYQQYASQINEEALGFMAYHPMEGDFQEQNGELTHILNDNHSYDTGSASEYIYGKVLNQTFSPAFLHVNVVNEDGSSVEFAHRGKINQIELAPLMEKLYFVTEAAGNRYIAAVNEMEAENVEQALQLLSELPPFSNFESPVIPTVTYSTVLNSDVAVVTFTEPLDVEAYDVAQVSMMLDAMIMTAASYGMRTQFDNVLGAEGFTYPIGEPIEKPIGANKIILNSN